MGLQARVSNDPPRAAIIAVVAVLWIGAGSFTLFTVLGVLANDPTRDDGSVLSAATATAEQAARGPLNSDLATTTLGPDPASRTVPELPDEGPGVSAPGVLLVATPTEGGAFEVWEGVRLPHPVDTVTLSPPTVADAGSRFETAEPVVTGVQLRVDGQRIQVPDGVVEGKFDVPVEQILEFELSYQLDGTSVRSLPSSNRRALAAISPLLDDTAYNLPVAVVVNGPVRGVDCPLLDPSDRACGRGTTQQMQVNRNLPFDQALVTVQFDIPAK